MGNRQSQCGSIHSRPARMVVQRATYKRPVVHVSLERTSVQVSITSFRHNSCRVDTLCSKSSATPLTSGMSGDGPTVVDDPPLDLNIGHPTLWLSEPHVPADATETKKQTFSSASRQTVIMSNSNNGVARMGSVLDNGHFVCDDEACAGRTFGRQADLRRHYTTLHAANKPSFWCHVSSCRRSIGGGGKAFHRKDKLMAHVRSMHHPDM